MNELITRLENAAAVLTRLISDKEYEVGMSGAMHYGGEVHRLRGKLEGVNLALSYIREMQRD